MTLPDAQPAHDVLSKVWARKKIEDLSSQLHTAAVPEVIAEITDIALAYRLMTHYTSFVAVDENDMQPINQEAKAPRQVVVPLPLPEGTDFSGVYSVPGLKVGAPRVMSRQQLRTARVLRHLSKTVRIEVHLLRRYR